MSACGPLTPRESDASGVIRFLHADLREMGRITVIDAEGRKKDLTDSEMRGLLATCQLDRVWK